MPRTLIDMAGRRIGRWTVLSKSGVRDGHAQWLCRCDCGEERSVEGASLRRNESLSCGCLRASPIVVRTQHIWYRRNRPDDKRHTVWIAMRQRCNNPSNSKYPDYGGRGISVCSRWERIENFLEDMGECPTGMTLDRIDNDGNYEPGNCKWSTHKEQAENRREKRAV